MSHALVRLLPLVPALLLAACGSSSPSAPSTLASPLNVTATGAPAVAVPSHSVSPDGVLTLNGQLNHNRTGAAQLRTVGDGAVNWITVGSSRMGTFTASITPAQARQSSPSFDYALVEWRRFSQAPCRSNTLALSPLSVGGHWVQYLYVDGANGAYREKTERLPGNVYRTRTIAYVYADGASELRGSADCDLPTHAGPMRQVLQADFQLRPGWNAVITEGLRYPDDHLEVRVRMGDDPEVPWVDPSAD